MKIQPRPRIPLFDNLPGDWVADALCAQTNPDDFFPERGDNTSRAKSVCRVCPVRDLCLQHAIATDERFGLWGGKTPEERRDIRDGVVPGWCALDGCHLRTMSPRARYCSGSHAAKAGRARQLGRAS